jgi:hypothetical protein
MKSLIFFAATIIFFVACKKQTLTNYSRQKLNNKPPLDNFVTPILRETYHQAELVVSVKIVRKDPFFEQGVVFSESGRSLWHLHLVVEQIFKNSSHKKINIGDTINTVLVVELPAQFIQSDSTFWENSILSLPNLDNFRPHSICFFKKVSKESKAYYKAKHRVLYADQPWQFDWVDLFFAYYTPIDIASNDMFLKDIPIHHLAASTMEHQHLKKIIGKRKYDEFRLSRHRYWYMNNKEKFNPK